MLKRFATTHIRWIAHARVVLLTLMSGSLAAVNGCEGWSVSENPPIETQIVWKVSALKNPLTQLNANEGLEFDLLEQFARAQGARLQWQFRNDHNQILNDLKLGKAQISAGRWSQEKIEEARDFVRIGAAYEKTAFSLVCPQNIKSRDELSLLDSLFSRRQPSFEKTTKKTLHRTQPDLYVEEEKILVFIRSLDYFHELKNELNTTYPHWQIVELKPGQSAQKILKNRRTQFCVLTDSMMANYVLTTKPWLHLTKKLETKVTKNILFSPKNPDLSEKFNRWFQKQNRRGLMSGLTTRYHGYQKSLENSSRVRLLKAQQTRWRELGFKFKNYAQEFELPWQLLAAVAFQESHWNESAQSHTGVRGIMQLTKNTAQFLGVEDREDLEQSLWGGAKYLRYLLDMQPESLHFRDRMMLALVAYNVGPAGLREAQKRAVENGENPFLFWHLKEHLHRLPAPTRGSEAVEFTERVFAYYDVLLDSH